MEQIKTTEEDAIDWEGWTQVKPNFNELNQECILLTASGDSLNSWLIKKIDNGDDGWYWGLCDISGYEWGDMEDLEAQLYKVVYLPKKVDQDEK